MDQAASLRNLNRPGGKAGGSPQTPSVAPLLAIASGKGGVGKTFLALNLALALCEQGLDCLLVDLDWGLANIDVAVGLAPRRHLGHVVTEACALPEALIEYEGIRILPNGCGQANLARLSSDRRIELLAAVRGLQTGDGIVVADTHPGIAPCTLDVAREATATVVVSTSEPTALTDTYALFKLLGETGLRGPAGLVLNQVPTVEEAYEAARQLDSVSRRFLRRAIPCWGHVLADSAVPRCVGQQQPVLTAAPRSAAARGVREIAGGLLAFLRRAGGCTAGSAAG